MSEKKTKQDDLYASILEDASVKQQLNIFSYTGSQPLVKKTRHIFADRLYWQELLPYVVDYGYEAVNNFCLIYAEKIAKKDDNK